jgi:hypothetical protein
MVVVKSAKDIRRLICQFRKPADTANSTGGTENMDARPVRRIKRGDMGVAMTGKEAYFPGKNDGGKNADRNAVGTESS